MKTVMPEGFHVSSSRALGSSLGNGWHEGEGGMLCVTRSEAELAPGYLRNRSKHNPY